MPKIAIITRTKDRPVLLRRAIESVLDQVYTDWEHVIVNDGGDREVVDFLAEFYKDRYNGRLNLIHNNASRGMEAASNTGIRASESKFISIHDDDDSWSPDFLSVMSASLENTDIRTVKGAVSQVNSIVEKIVGFNIIPESVEPYFPLKSRLVSLNDILAANLFPPISFIFEREYAGTLSFYDESYPVLGDWDFNVRFLQKADIIVVPRYLAYYHIRNTGAHQNTLLTNQELHDLYTTKLKNRWIRDGLLAPGSSKTETDPETMSSELHSHIDALQNALHNTALTIDNIQKQEDIIFQRIENIENNILLSRKGRWISGLRNRITGCFRHRDP